MESIGAGIKQGTQSLATLFQRDARSHASLHRQTTVKITQTLQASLFLVFQCYEGSRSTIRALRMYTRMSVIEATASYQNSALSCFKLVGPCGYAKRPPFRATSTLIFDKTFGKMIKHLPEESNPTVPLERVSPRPESSGSFAHQS